MWLLRLLDGTLVSGWLVYSYIACSFSYMLPSLLHMTSKSGSENAKRALWSLGCCRAECHVSALDCGCPLIVALILEFDSSSSVHIVQLYGVMKAGPRFCNSDSCLPSPAPRLRFKTVFIFVLACSCLKRLFLSPIYFRSDYESI